MNEKQIKKIIMAVDSSLMKATQLYLAAQQHSQSFDKQSLLNLIFSLKRWSNPYSNFSLQIPSEHLPNFAFIPSWINNPKRLNASISSKDEAFLRQLIYIRLDCVANRLIEEANLQNEIDQKLAIDNFQGEQWWEKLELPAQLEIKSNYKNLTNEELDILLKLKRELCKRNVPSENIIKNPDLFNYFLFCHYQATCSYHHLNFSSYKNILNSDLTLLTQPATSSQIFRKIAKITAAIASISIFLLPLIVILSAGYALQKSVKSLVNFINGQKMLRSLFRLAGIVTLSYIGAIKVGILGGIIGTFIPVIGNATGFVVGSVLGGSLGAAIGGAIAKYSARLISAVFHQGRNNSTNTEKYELNLDLIDKHIKRKTNFELLHQAIRTLRNEKKKLGLRKIIPFSEAKKENEYWNNLLKQIKNGEIDKNIIIGEKNFGRLSTHAELSNRFNSSSINLDSLGNFLEENSSEKKNSFQPQPRLSDQDIRPVCQHHDSLLTSTVRPAM